MTELLEDVRRRVLGIRRVDWVHEFSGKGTLVEARSKEFGGSYWDRLKKEQNALEDAVQELQLALEIGDQKNLPRLLVAMEKHSKQVSAMYRRFLKRRHESVDYSSYEVLEAKPTHIVKHAAGKSMAGTIERFRSTVYSRMKKAEHYANKEDLDKAWKELDAAMISIQSLTKAINIARHESVDYSSDDAEELPEKVINRLEAEGIKVRHWDRGGNVRYYLKQGGRDLGYLVPGDDGSSGTCKGITKRQGYIADLVRSALRESVRESHEGNALSDDMFRLMDTVRFRFQRAEQLAAQGLEDDAWSEIDHAQAAFQAMMGESVEFSLTEMKGKSVADTFGIDALDYGELTFTGRKTSKYKKGQKVMLLDKSGYHDSTVTVVSTEIINDADDNQKYLAVKDKFEVTLEPLNRKGFMKGDKSQ